MASRTKLQRPALVRQKMVPPGMPVPAIARPRLDALFAKALDEHEALAVFATAGSGKTVQAQLFAASLGWPLVWLTLDSRDRSPSRMLSYLAAALAPHVDAVEDILGSAFGASAGPEEVATVLAEAIDVPQLLVVIDQCEMMAESAQSCAVLETFLDFLPGGVRTILLGRTEMPFSLGRLLLHGRVGRVTDEDLALTPEEAAELVQARGDDPSKLEARLVAARGWIAAVAFGGSHRPGGHDHRDFIAYLESEVLALLPPEEQRFLRDTSILDAVSLRAATALCGTRARTVWRSVGMRHLPATTSPDRTIVYHPCFRNFLREQLELEDPERMRELQHRHAALLLTCSQFEEATELLLSLGALDEAASAAEEACGALMDRTDWETFLRWAEALGTPRLEARPVLLGAMIKSLRGVRRLPEARTLVRELDAAGKLGDVLADDPGLMAHVGWTMRCQPVEGIELIDRYGPGPGTEAIRYMLEATSGEDPVAPPVGLGSNETDRLVSWALMVQGRLEDLMAMLPSDDQWPPRSPYTTPHPLVGLIWRGELKRARVLFDQVPEEMKQRGHTDLWHYIEAWLLLAERDAPNALLAAERAVVHSRRTSFGFEAVFEVVQAQALLQLERVDDAVEVLEESIESSRRSGLRAYIEWAQVVLGRARLLQGHDGVALELLREASTAMQRAERLLLLPMAAVYLAEAERRAGNAERADAAAALAYDVSVQMGAFPALQLALSHFPTVRSHQLERNPTDGWRRLGSASPIALVRRPPTEDPGTEAFVQPFGPDPDIYVGGERT